MWDSMISSKIHSYSIIKYSITSENKTPNTIFNEHSVIQKLTIITKIKVLFSSYCRWIVK